MSDETNVHSSLRHWKPFVKQFCPRCYQTSSHKFVKLAGAKAATRKGHKGMVYMAQYMCLTDECEQLVEVEVFAPFPVQTVGMFPDDEIPF